MVFNVFWGILFRGLRFRVLGFRVFWGLGCLRFRVFKV